VIVVPKDFRHDEAGDGNGDPHSHHDLKRDSLVDENHLEDDNVEKGKGDQSQSGRNSGKLRAIRSILVVDVVPSDGTDAAGDLEGTRRQRRPDEIIVLDGPKDVSVNESNAEDVADVEEQKAEVAHQVGGVSVDAPLVRSLGCGKHMNDWILKVGHCCS